MHLVMREEAITDILFKKKENRLDCNTSRLHFHSSGVELSFKTASESHLEGFDSLSSELINLIRLQVLLSVYLLTVLYCIYYSMTKRRHSYTQVNRKITGLGIVMSSKDENKIQCKPAH